MSSPTVEFAGVSKAYGSVFRPGRTVNALRGVSFAVGPGEVFAIVGPNRAGKTTLLKTVLGLCRPSAGEVRRLGRPVSDRRTLARVGYMHENQAFPGFLTATTLLEYYGGFCRLSGAALRARIPGLLERVGLADRAREPISWFSKGMVQRLALAQSVLNTPDLLVLDEPMEGLDLDARLLLDEIVDEHRRGGKTVILVSHALGQVEKVCDRIAVMVGGRLAHLGPVDPLLVDPLTGLDRSLEAALTPIYRS